VVVVVDGLHDDAPARLVAATAIARLSAGEDGDGLDDGGDGRGNAGRHFEDMLKAGGIIYPDDQLAAWTWQRQIILDVELGCRRIRNDGTYRISGV
jgi:hypothetical protein